MKIENITISDRVLFQKIGNEFVILDLNGDKYFGLDEVGGRIWEMLNDTGDVNEVIKAMLNEFEVPEEQLREDVQDLIDKLVEAGLAVKNGTEAS